jgi:hypothetical protein
MVINVYTMVNAGATAVCDVMKMGGATEKRFLVPQTMVCSNEKIFLGMKTIFLVAQKMFSGFAPIF